MSTASKADKKRMQAQRASASGGSPSPSVVSQVRKRSVDSMVKRKSSLDTIMNKRMRSKPSASKLTMSHDRSTSDSRLLSPRSASRGVAERPAPTVAPFDVHVFAGHCPGAHAAFFDAQVLGEEEESRTKITLLPRTTKLTLSKSAKKKRNKGRNRKKEADLDDSVGSKEDSGESSASETTKQADTPLDATEPTAPTPTADSGTPKSVEIDTFDYVLLILQHSALFQADMRSSPLSMLPKRVQAQFSDIVSDVYMDELPVGACVSILLNRGKRQTRVGIVSLSRCDGAYASYDCMYTAVRNSLAHFYHKASSKLDGGSRLLLVMPSLDRVKWNNKYSGCTEAAAAVFQVQLSLDVFGCCAEENAPDLVHVDQMLQTGPKKTEGKTDDIVVKLLREGKLLDRGLRDSDEVSRLIAVASNEEESSSHDQELQDMAIYCIADIISSHSSAIAENLSVFLRQNVLTTQSCLARVIELAQNGKILLHRPVEMKDIEQGTKIGAGGTATVYEGTHQGKPVAIKLFFEDCPLPELRRELALMSLLEHPQLARLIGASLEGDRAALVLELVERGSLFQILKDKEQFDALTWKQKMEIAFGVSTSMRYLHSFGIIHRDLKSPNVLVTEDWNTKLTDYGSSRIMSKIMTQNAGTLAWSAPEVLMSDNYSEKADVYSFGMLLYEIATGDVPFSDLKDFQVTQQVMKGARPSYDRGVPRQWQKLSKLCWAAKPSARPDFAKISSSLQAMMQNTH